MKANSRIRPAAKFFFEGDRKFFVKGVTYGPFKPDAEGNYLGWPEQLDVDLALMCETGVNVVRIYHSPPRWFLDRCAAAGVRVLVTLPGRNTSSFCANDPRANRSPKPCALPLRRTPAIRRSSVISLATKSPARWRAGSAYVESWNLSRS